MSKRSIKRKDESENDLAKLENKSNATHAPSGLTGPLRRATVRDIANRAGVAISSVSRVFSQHPNVSDELRSRVEAAARELSYQPNYVAHSLRRGDTASVGFLVGTISNPTIADISSSTSAVLAQHGYGTLLVITDNRPENDLAYLNFLARRQVSGMVVSLAAWEGHANARSLIAELGIPTVMLDRTRIEVPHVGAVMSDHIAGMKAAVLHLAEQGHRSIAFLGGPPGFDPGDQRQAGYRQGLAQAALPLVPDLIIRHGIERGAGYATTKALFAGNHQPTAIIAGGNLILAGVLRALQELQIGVGTDIALIGCDDTDLTQLYTPSITVISRNLQKLGATAADTLIELMGRQPGRTILLPTRLEVRASSCLRI